MDIFASIATVRSGLTTQGYLAGERTAAAVYLAWHLQKPLLVEGPAGVGKTGLAVAMAGAMATELVRLQCYPGLDEAKALYEWNYQKQLLYINAGRQGEHGWERLKEDIYAAEFLLERPLLKAFRSVRPSVLLIDEVDKSDEELESFFLEALSDFQVTIPEMGTVRAEHIPLVVLTSNSTRDLGDALKRRCLHLFIPYPDVEREAAIVLLKVPDIGKGLAAQLAAFVQALRKIPLKKAPSVAETIDWARTMVLMGARSLEPALVESTLNVLLKYEEDLQKAAGHVPDLLGATADAGAKTGGPKEEKEKGTEKPGRLEELLARFNF